MDSISPLDSRYSSKLHDVRSIFSNANFTKYKCFVECEYLKFVISCIKDYTPHQLSHYNKIIEDISNYIESNPVRETEKITNYETKTNHDIQALVMYIRDLVPEEIREMVHFGLTSQDINSPAMVLSYRDFNNTIFLIEIERVMETLHNIGTKNKNTIMLTFTHGQPATPSTFKKQMDVFIHKLGDIIHDLEENYEYKTKMGGSNGDLTALKVSYPKIDWEISMDRFVSSQLLLMRNRNTTQIDDYINYYRLFHIYQRTCVILINLCQDIWLYCSKNYLKMRNVAGEVGSSAMPHKINPIHFENAEGNLKLATDMFESIGKNICINRLQRDLTDSTLLRNVGVACGYMILAIRNINTGLARIEVNIRQIQDDINENSIVIIEFIQLIMRSNGIPNGYELCKKYARGRKKFDFPEFIEFMETNNIEITTDFIELLNLEYDKIFNQ
jgi:adenylosuccinate lyase